MSDSPSVRDKHEESSDCLISGTCCGGVFVLLVVGII